MSQQMDKDHQEQADEIVLQFLKTLDACQTERERIDAVMVLVYGVIQGAINANSN